MGRQAGIAGEGQKKGLRLEMEFMGFYALLSAFALLENKALQICKP